MKNEIFFPLLATCRFPTDGCLFFHNSSLFCIYFTFLLPIFSFSFKFDPFSLTSPFFLFPFSYFSPNGIGLYSPLGGGRAGYFPIYRPLGQCCGVESGSTQIRNYLLKWSQIQTYCKHNRVPLFRINFAL